MIAFLAAIALILPSTILIRPLVAHALTKTATKKIHAPLNSLALLIGPLAFLVLFSLWGRILPNYGWTFFCALLTIGSLSYLFRGRTAEISTNDTPFIVSFSALFILSFILRTYWPAIPWENSVERLGVERMFNLSMQQSFLYSSAWPPNNLWLNGEPIHYHLLLRAAPGIASWLARVCCNAPLAGGSLYLIFDAWYLCLAPLAVAVWAYLLIPTSNDDDVAERRFRSRRLVLSLLLGLLTFLAPHGAALLAGIKALYLGNTVDFWNIQHEVVRGTVNFFPFGLLLSGESHSYAQAPFLQICLWGALMWQVSTPFSWSRSLISGLLAAALAMAHPASAFLSVCALTAVGASLVTIRLRSTHRRDTKQLLVSLGISAFFAAIFYLPEYLTLRVPETRWVFVTRSLASQPLEFLSAQAAPLAVMCLLLGVTTQLSDLRAASKSYPLTLLALGACAIISVVTGRPAIGVAIAVFTLLGALAARSSRVQGCQLFAFSLGLAVIWILPELLVSDWAIDNRTVWVRFNTVMRFWLDGYYLIPLVAIAILGARIVESPRRYRLCVVFFTLLLCTEALSVYPLLQNRLERTREERSADGFRFLSKEHPADWWLIDYLARLPGQVVLGEVCGNGSSQLTPYHYGMPGRLSAFSGRPSVCGWGRHTWMFQPLFEQGTRRGQSVWSSFLEYEKALREIYSRNSSPDLISALSYLRERGVTHLAFGELEEAVFGKIDLAQVAERLQGTLLTQPITGRGIIQLPR